MGKGGQEEGIDNQADLVYTPPVWDTNEEGIRFRLTAKSCVSRISPRNHIRWARLERLQRHGPSSLREGGRST